MENSFYIPLEYKFSVGVEELENYSIEQLEAIIKRTDCSSHKLFIVWHIVDLTRRSIRV